MTTYINMFAGTDGFRLNSKRTNKAIADSFVFANEDNNQVLTTSLRVAEVFGKEHSNVVMAIDNLIEKLQDVDNQCDLKSATHNFDVYYEDVPQPNGGTKSAKRYVMNRDGFTLLAMGFTGKKALKFKVDYIDAFNSMEAELRKRSTPQLPMFVQRHLLNVNKVGYQYFSIINAIFEHVYMPLEKAGYILPDISELGSMLTPDISVAKGFCNFLRKRGVDPSKFPTYIHKFGDSRKNVEAIKYPIEYLPLFIRYVHEEWLPKQAPKYLRNKAPEALQYLPKLLN